MRRRARTASSTTGPLGGGRRSGPGLDRAQGCGSLDRLGLLRITLPLVAGRCGAAVSALGVRTSAWTAWVRICPRSPCAGELGDDAAVAHDEQPVAQPDELGQLGRHHDDRRARRRPAPGSPGRSRPWRRRRRRGSARRAGAPCCRAAASGRARPSAGCRPTARVTSRRDVAGPGLERLELRGSRPWRSPARSTNGPVAEPAEVGHGHVLDQVPRAHSPSALRSSGASPTPARTATSGRPGRQRIALRPRPCRASGRSRPAMSRSSSVRPGADEPGDADDLAAPDLEADVVDEGPAGQAVDPQRRPRPRRCRRRPGGRGRRRPARDRPSA